MNINKMNGRWSNLTNTLQSWYSKLWLRIIIDIIGYLPVSLAVIYYSNVFIRDKIDTLLRNWPKTLASLTEYSLWFFFGALAITYICKNLIPFITTPKNKNRILTIEGAIALMESLSSIVKTKSTRFGDLASSCVQNSGVLTGKNIFETITQPDQQIQYTLYALHTFLDKILNDDIDITVRLISIENKTPIEWYAYAPDDNQPSTPIKELNCSNSALTHCIRKQKIFVIPDIKKETAKMRGHYVLCDDEDGTGSLICYPIYHLPTKDYPFVITIRTSKPNIFSSKEKDLYNWIINQFAQRIQLEYSLSYLKGVVLNDR